MYLKDKCSRKLQCKHFNGKKQTGGFKIWNFQGHWKNNNWILQELIKNNEDFSVHDQEKHYVELPGVLALGLKTSEGCNATIMWKT